MFKKIKESLDSRYLKVCTYAAGTVILTAVMLLLLYLTGGIWRRLWTLLLAVLHPIILGGILCYLMTPLVARMERMNPGRKSSRVTAVILSYLLVLLIIAALLSLILLTAYKSFSGVSLEGLIALFLSLEGQLAGFAEEALNKLSATGLPFDRMGSLFTGFLSGVKNFAVTFFFGIISSVYFLLDGQVIADYWINVFRALTGKTETNRLRIFLADADRVFSGYIRGQFVDAVVVGLLSSLALFIAGIPSAAVIGVLTGIGNLIPYVGPLVGYCTLVIVCLPTGAWMKLLIGAVVLALVMFVDSNLINPRLLSSNVKVHPFLVVVALIGGGSIGGFLGMIIAVPTAALLKIQLDRFVENRKKGI